MSADSRGLTLAVLQLTNDEKLVALEEHFEPHKLYRFPTRLEYDIKAAFL